MRKLVIVLNLAIGLLLCCFCYATELRIIQSADTHLQGLDNIRAENLAGIVQFAGRQGDILLVCGDLTQGGGLEWSSLKENQKNEMQLRQCADLKSVLTIPALNVIGNHDNYFAFIKIFGDDHSCIDINEYRFIGINTNDPDYELIEYWLAKGQGKVLIIAGHQPLRYGGELNTKKNIADKLEYLFDKYGVSYYLHGHTHRSKTRMVSGIVQIGCGASKTGNCNLVILKDGKLVSVEPI